MDLYDLPCYVEGFDPGMNLRDLGGWPAADGRHVRRGLLYRSARLCELDDAEIVRLLQLPVRCVVDLRPRDEMSALPDPRLPSIRYEHADMGREPLDEADVRDLTPAEFVEAAATRTAAMAFGNPGIARLLSLMEGGNVPLLFHCNSGRDRSGVAAMVVLMALGCDDEALMADYLLTNAYRADAIDLLSQRYAAATALGEEYRALVMLMAGVLPQVGAAVLAAIDARYPTRETYLASEYGLGPAHLARLRASFLA